MLIPQRIVQPPASGAPAASPGQAAAPDTNPRATDRVFVVPPTAAPFVVKPEDRAANDLAARMFAMGRERHQEQAGAVPFRKSAEKRARGRKGRRR
jgi:hypothetical protein